MGTWDIPQTKEELEEAKKILAELKLIRKHCILICGDDELFDSLDSAIDRMKLLVNYVKQWKKYTKS